MALQDPGQPRQATGGRIAADTGIDHAIAVPFVRESLLQQRYPGFSDFESETGAQRIPQNHDGFSHAGRVQRAGPGYDHNGS